ncbi:R3H domain-containing protein 4-like [Xenia sp. Carnegie-2017]|uniref:R3H domain-containing protein 4-like n=1 Tax=Xenia sp. Carnegie-2017 TaxID=2897299 RepID=UPI001F0436C6|nr:R3H domain-containing protein 4-like [Xenia sp. Carnegie-2017]
MGVLNTPDCRKRAELLNYVIDDDDQDSSFEISHALDLNERNNQRRRRRNNSLQKSSKAARPQSHIKNTGRKAKGCCNSRKFENANFLAQMIECEDFGDLNIADFMVQSASAFEKVFQNESQLKRWNAFMNLKGEDQDQYLHELSQGNDYKITVSQQTSSIQADFGIASKCFQNVEHKIKSTLKGRNISMSGLKYFEQELLYFFNQTQETVLISLIPSSMDRLIIHGICQYLNLSSQSEPKNVIQVENQKSEFFPPNILLSQYLERTR